MHQPVIQRHQFCRVKAQTRQHTRPVRFQQHIGHGDKPTQHRPALLGFQVQPGDPLVAIDDPIPERDAVFIERAIGGLRVAVGWLYLHDVCAKIRQQHRAIRPGDELAQVQHPDAL